MDRHASNIYRLDTGQWGYFTGSAYIPCNAEQCGDRFFRLKFVSNRPSREFICITEHFASTHIGNFDHKPVDQKIKRIAHRYELIKLFFHRTDTVHKFHHRTDLKPVIAQKGNHLLVVPEL
ncbi:Uncharacterised protein [Mycobacterium tuberculosis]|nr:Uncharacterised protein [Mycobacterium tuberculosis]